MNEAASFGQHIVLWNVSVQDIWDVALENQIKTIIWKWIKYLSPKIWQGHVSATYISAYANVSALGKMMHR